MFWRRIMPVPICGWSGIRSGSKLGIAPKLLLQFRHSATLDASTTTRRTYPSVLVTVRGLPRSRAWRASTAASRLLKKVVSRLFVSMVARMRPASIGADRRSGGVISWAFASSSELQAASRYRGQDFWDANEIVGRRCQDEEPFHQATPTVASLAQAADGLHPPEWLLDPLALDRADAVAGMPGRARIDRRTAVAIVLRDVRCTAAFTTACDEVGRVIVLVGAHRAAQLGLVRDHVELSP